MDDRLKESVSALMDDEANELELQRVLSNVDSDVSATWQRYHQIRQVVRENNRELWSVDIRASLAEKLNMDEPHAPEAERSATALETEEAGRNKLSFAGAKRGRFRASLAIAASAVLAVFVGVQYQSGIEGGAVSGPLVAQEGTAAPDVRQPKMIVEFSEEHARQFNEYLLRHAEYSIAGSGQGLLPLARVASVNSVGI